MNTAVCGQGQESTHINVFELVKLSWDHDTDFYGRKCEINSECSRTVLFTYHSIRIYHS